MPVHIIGLGDRLRMSAVLISTIEVGKYDLYALLDIKNNRNSFWLASVDEALVGEYRSVATIVIDCITEQMGEDALDKVKLMNMQEYPLKLILNDMRSVYGRPSTG